jgi:mannose-6-phosphate isomerase
VEAVTRLGPVDPVRPEATADAAVRRLVACEYLVLDEVRPASSWWCGGDGRCHVVAVLEGEARLPDRWGLPAVGAGDCALPPASAGAQEITATNAKLLRITVP